MHFRSCGCDDLQARDAHSESVQVVQLKYQGWHQGRGVAPARTDSFIQILTRTTP